MKLLNTILLIGAAGLAQAATVSLDLRPKAVRLQSVTSAPLETGVLRRTSLGAGAAQASGLAVGDHLSLTLYDNVTLDLTLVEKEESAFAGRAFQATVAGARWRDAVVLETEDGLQVTATDPDSGRVYTVVSAASGVTVREIDPNAEPTVPTAPLVPTVSSTSARTTSAVPSAAAATEQASTLVDMLVAYDTPAATWARTNVGGITNLAQQCVTRMNTALANNGLDAKFRFRLVGVIAVNANGNSNLNDTLSKVTGSVGAWSAVTTLRNEVGADIVSTMIDTGSAYGSTGLGYSLTRTTPTEIANFSENAHNVISVRAAAQGHEMTHETGHNMGAGHPEIFGGPQSYDYSRGYYFTGSDGTPYHTIMSYNYDLENKTYRSAPLFSDPDATWAGVAAGDSTHNNAKVIADNFALVAQFRTQKIGNDVIFSPGSGMVFESSLLVSLSPGEAGLEIRYTTDGSTPTASHGTIYTSPVTITQTTTFKAVTVENGVAGPICTALYALADLGNALNAPQLKWETGSDYPWSVQSLYSYDGLAAQSAQLPETWNVRTWLSATVSYVKKMSFRYRNEMYCGGQEPYVNSFKVSIDSSPVWTTKVESDDWTFVEIDIPAGTHTVKFEYEQWGWYSGMFGGVWLDDVKFTPEDGVLKDDGHGNAITIPRTWFVDNGLVQSGASTGALSAAADADADGDGLANWKEYVCGTGPNDADERLSCTISVVNGVPNVDYAPKSGFISGYQAILKGKETLGDDWQPKADGHRFFRVFVEKTP